MPPLEANLDAWNDQYCWIAHGDEWRLVASLAGRHGLQVVSQVDSGGEQGQYNVKLFGHFISTLRKPGAD